MLLQGGNHKGMQGMQTLGQQGTLLGINSSLTVCTQSADLARMHAHKQPFDIGSIDVASTVSLIHCYATANAVRSLRAALDAETETAVCAAAAVSSRVPTSSCQQAQQETGLELHHGHLLLSVASQCKHRIKQVVKQSRVV